jgi:hypothetical protein
LKVYQQLLLLEQQLLSEKLLLDQKFKGLDGIKQILSRLDISYELPNEHELKGVCALLEDLKGEALTAQEYELVQDILGAVPNKEKKGQKT